MLRVTLWLTVAGLGEAVTVIAHENFTDNTINNIQNNI